jgi:hypothetical protein
VPHPILWISWIVSAIWFFAAASMAKRRISVAVLYALAGPLVWSAVALTINFVPKLIPFAGLPFLTLMDMPYFFFFGAIPSGVAVFWMGLRLKKVLNEPSNRLSRYGRRSETVAIPDSLNQLTNSGFDMRAIVKGVAAVTMLYAIGSALSYGLDSYDIAFVKWVNFRWPMHLGALIGFVFVGLWVKQRLLLSLGIVFVCSYLLTGIYEELWRRVIWDGGYMWSYHVWTLPEWLATLILGAILGRALAKRRGQRSLIERKLQQAP